MRTTFALDVDGVVLDIVPGALEYVNGKYPEAFLSEEDVTDWDWDYVWSLPGGLGPEFWEHVWNTPAKAYEGAHQFIEDLHLMNFRVIAISTRPQEWKGIGSAARDAGHRDFAQFDFDAIHYVDRHKEKVQVMLDEEAKFMVEDNPKNAMEASLDAGATSFLITRPWNNHCLTVNNAWYRVDSYAEILDAVRGS